MQKYPVVSTKPPDALVEPEDDVPIHATTKGMLNYEGELTVVIGKDAKNAGEKALDYVLGYTLGNHVSARNFQLPNVSADSSALQSQWMALSPFGQRSYQRTKSWILRNSNTLQE
jgi:transcription initiation factor TFIIH subunit 2